MTDIVLIDFHEVRMTMTQVMERVYELIDEYPDHEIFMDGDRFAIVARPKVVA